MAKLNQILAIEKNVKNRHETEYTKLHQALQKTELLNGFVKTYKTKDEDGERFPPESKKVQIRADDALQKMSDSLSELFDAAAAKDATNCLAKADVVVDGVTLLKDVPATHLLFLEKRLVEMVSTMKKLPTLDDSETWTRDDNQGLWVTPLVETVKTRKITEHVVVVQPTKEHPAQVKDDTKDVVVGTWTTVKYSGALQVTRVQEIVARAEKLQKAVKYAREEANCVQAVELKSAVLLNYLFK